MQGQVVAWAAAHTGEVLWIPASLIIDSTPWAGFIHVVGVNGELCLWGPEINVCLLFSEAQQCKPNCVPLAYRTIMTKEGDRGRGPLGGPSMPAARAWASQRKEVNKGGRGLA